MLKAEFKSLYELFEAIPDEAAAINHFLAIRWANGEYCAYCGHDKVYRFKKVGVFKCAECRARFTWRIGTIFEDTKIPLRKWLATIWLITSHKKGIASTQLAKDIDVTQKTAWFMTHRLRHAARTRSFNRPLRGVVETDESAFGGKERFKHRHKRGKTEKVLVLGMLERGGELRAKPVESIKQVLPEVLKSVQSGATLMTDEHVIYGGMHQRYDHRTVNHGADEWSKDDGFTHVNSIEGVWSLIKRQIYGIHHFVSEKHLAKYIAEATWRFNRRDLKDAAPLNEFLTRVDGHLTYNALIAKV
jgi:transposase-like protein